MASSRTVGADPLRLFHLSVAPPVDDFDWTDQSNEMIDGGSGFLRQVWQLATETDAVVDETEGDGRNAIAIDETALRRGTHRVIAAVTEDFGRYEFNTAVARCPRAAPARSCRGCDPESIAPASTIRSMCC